MIEAGFSPKKLVHIPTFIRNNEIKNCVENKKRQIIYLGRVDETKGIHILLKAIKILQEESFRDFYCVIAGSGPDDYIKRLQDYLKKNNIRNVYFAGQLEKIKLYELLQESLFSVAPSLWYDNMPNSVLESLAAGTPAIASNHGSLPEIIRNGETGLLFNPGDAKDLSNKIKILLDNKELIIKMSKNAKKYIKENHSPEKHYENIMHLYDELRKENTNL